MNINLEGKWGKKIEKKINGYEFQIGILEDGPHFEPVETKIFGEPALKNYAGGPARQQTRKTGELTIGEIFIKNMERLNTNLLLEPFRAKKNADIVKFSEAFLKLAMERPGISIKRVENLLQAIVRNPILRGDYGANSSATADAKGFDRHLIDTAQMFKAIMAKATKRG